MKYVKFGLIIFLLFNIGCGNKDQLNIIINKKNYLPLEFKDVYLGMNYKDFHNIRKNCFNNSGVIVEYFKNYFFVEGVYFFVNENNRICFFRDTNFEKTYLFSIGFTYYKENCDWNNFSKKSVNLLNEIKNILGKNYSIDKKNNMTIYEWIKKDIKIVLKLKPPQGNEKKCFIYYDVYNERICKKIRAINKK